MPNYFPIPIPLDFDNSASDLVLLTYRDRGIIADFLIPDRGQENMRVSFAHVEIVRTMDELHLSMEDKIPEGGLRKFAYRVESARFWETQHEALSAIFPRLRHYRFITGWTCLDVLANEEPVITLAQSSP